MPVASKIKVEETIVGDTLDGKAGNKGIPNLVQQRTKIDRFTGGTYPQALFSQQAVWGKG